MTTKGVAKDLAISSAAGLLATRIMEPVTTAIQKAQSEEDKEKEAQASPGLAAEVAARKTALAVGVELDESQAHTGGRLLHYGLAMSWAPFYVLLRRTTPLPPWLAGLATGTAMFLLADEALNSAMGYSAPPGAYPVVTHLRGLTGHLVYGAAVAVFTEMAWALRRPDSPQPAAG